MQGNNDIKMMGYLIRKYGDERKKRNDVFKMLKGGGSNNPELYI